MRILVYDDSEDFRQELTKKVDDATRSAKPRPKVGALDDIAKVLRGLEQKAVPRRKPAKSAEDQPDQAQVSGSTKEVDSVDVLMLDFDLRDVPGRALLTGEEVAYFTKSYSKCNLVVSINAVPQRTFDLRLRHTPIDSWADVSIHAADIDAPGLWTGEPTRTPTYRPWYWPVIPDLVRKFEKMSTAVADAWTEKPKLFDFLKVPEEVRSSFPKDLTTRAIGNPAKTTFTEILAARVRAQDVKRLAKENKAKIVASTIHSWLENVVLPGQHVLTDAPHLVHRYPSLLKGNPERTSDWNATADITVRPSAYLKTAPLGDAQFPFAEWLSRPAWWTTVVANQGAIDEVAAPWDYKVPKLVFAEDTSRFHPETECKPFAFAGTSPNSRRYVLMPRTTEPVRYEPAMRLALSRVE